ncbi:MAG: hypothetical protein QM744_10900 [Mesorhizobium sp.]
MPSLKIAAFAACLASAAAVSTAAEAQELNLVCSPDVKWCELLVKKFTEKTGVKVNAVRLSAGEAFARLKAEARNPKSDVWWGGSGDTYVQASQEGILTEYVSPQLGDLFPGRSIRRRLPRTGQSPRKAVSSVSPTTRIS